MAPIILTEKDRRRFEKFLKREPDTGCLTFTGSKDKHGYGRFSVGGRAGKPELAHRVAWLLAGHEITKDAPFVLHDCPSGDNPSCCEEAHLWAGTQADNVNDMARKGRGRKSRKGLPFGVAKSKSLSSFFAQVTHGGNNHYLGSFPTIAEAATAARQVKEGYLKP